MEAVEYNVDEVSLPIGQENFIHVKGVGVELPFLVSKKDGTRKYYRDAENNPGVILTIRGIHNVQLFGMQVELDQQHVMNARTAGRMLALVHELFERIGLSDDLHAALGEARAELREKLDGVDCSEHVEAVTE